MLNEDKQIKTIMSTVETCLVFVYMTPQSNFLTNLKAEFMSKSFGNKTETEKIRKENIEKWTSEDLDFYSTLFSSELCFDLSSFSGMHCIDTDVQPFDDSAYVPMENFKKTSL